MDASYKWRLYCETEETLVEGITDSATPPGYCFNNNQHTIDTDSQVIIDTLTQDDVTIKGVDTPTDEHLHIDIHGFQDLTGHNVYRFGDLPYDIEAGETNIFLEKFDATMYISGGGVDIPDYLYVSGVKTDQKPEKGDYNRFDLVDIDNVLGYGKTATISNVARSSNVATITTSADHNMNVGDVVCINVSDDTYDDLEVEIATVPSSTTFTYSNTGDDETEKAATGDVGLIVILAPFVPKDYNFPKKEWKCICGDAKAVPPGVYLRYTCVSVGATDYTVYVHYNMRT